MPVKIFLNEERDAPPVVQYRCGHAQPYATAVASRTGQPIAPQDLAPVFPMNLIEQEVSQERWNDIPKKCMDKYLIWRPSPLYRAVNFEKFLNCP